MPSNKRSIVGATIPAAALAVLLAGCGGDEGLTDLSGPATILLSASTLQIASLGDTARIDANVLDASGHPMSAPVTWSSSDRSVATVVDGLVTAVSNGSTKVTAVSGAASAEADVTVAQLAASITSEPDSVVLISLGDTTRLTATVRDGRGQAIAVANIAWESADTTVAKVSPDGMVTAVANGTAAITASASGLASSSKAVVQQRPDTVVISPGTLTLNAPGDTASLAGTVLDAGGSPIDEAAVAWGALDTGVISVSAAGLVTGVSEGGTTITATSGAASGAASVTVTYPALSVTTTSLPSGTVGAPYAEPLTATGGDGTYTWSVTAGALPPGLSLSSNGTITGTPEAAGTSDFTVEVSSAGQTAAAALSLLVNPAPVLQPDELCADYPSYAIVTFADPDLETEVRRELAALQPFQAPPIDLTCEIITGWNGPSPGSGIAGLTIPDNEYNITSLAGLQNFGSVTRLVLTAHQSTDISPLSGMTSLTDLRLNGVVVADLNPLSSHTSLEYISLGAGPTVRDLDPLSGLTNLRFLYLGGDSIADMSGLSGATGLEEFYLYGNVADISALSGKSSLRQLILAGNSISDISPLTGLTSLVDLRLGGNLITDISPLSGLTNLTFLQLRENQISDISPVSGLASLTYLDISSNSIASIGAMTGLTSLESLNLYNNQIGETGGLGDIVSLTSLNLFANALTDVTSLSTLVGLTSLNLSSNPFLSDIQALLDNTGLGAGDTVQLSGTSVGCTDVQALEAKGVTVTSGCQ